MNRAFLDRLRAQHARDHAAGIRYTPEPETILEYASAEEYYDLPACVRRLIEAYQCGNRVVGSRVYIRISAGRLGELQQAAEAFRAAYVAGNSRCCNAAVKRPALDWPKCSKCGRVQREGGRGNE